VEGGHFHEGREGRNSVVRSFFVATEKCMMLESNYCFSYTFLLMPGMLFAVFGKPEVIG
jgi:hypothetical protein